MKRKFRIKNSKRGISLIELVVGITLVVVVFASCLGAMVGGYTTTLYNADETRMASLNASLNEMILNNLSGRTQSDIEKLIDKRQDAQDDPTKFSPADVRLKNIINDNIKAADGVGLETAVYVSPENFTAPPEKDGVDYSVRYTLVTDTVSQINTGGTKPVEITGVWIRTCFESAKGPTFYDSFVPYKT